MPSPTTAKPARRRTARAADVTRPGPGGWAPSGARWGRGGTGAVAVAAAVRMVEPAREPGSYLVLFVHPTVDPVGASNSRRVGAVQVGAIGLAAETVPKPSSGQRHQHGGRGQCDREQHLSVGVGVHG